MISRTSISDGPDIYRMDPKDLDRHAEMASHFPNSLNAKLYQVREILQDIHTNSLPCGDSSGNSEIERLANAALELLPTYQELRGEKND